MDVEVAPARDDAIGHGSVVIAAITSCTNTSNPSVMVAAGLLARKAVEAGLETRPWVKTSLAPGSRVVTDYLDRAGLTPYLDKLGFALVGYGCTTCIGNSGPLIDEVAAAVDERDLNVVAVLSGNRNFEGRVHPQVRAAYLASPPLCVAYALAGRVDLDLTADPLGEGAEGPVYLRDVWPSPQEVAEAVAASITPEQFEEEYGRVWDGDEHWRGLPSPIGPMYAWDAASTYVQEPPFFDDLEAVTDAEIEGARVLVKVGDSITTDHISPAGAIKADAPAGRYLQERGVAPADFNSYGSRRGNHEVMMRGTFANIRLRNEMAPGTEGSFTTLSADGRGHERLRGGGALPRGRDAARRPGGQGVRQRLEPRLGGEGPQPPRRAIRDRGELRAHPPVQPRGDGGPAAAVRGRSLGRVARSRRHRDPRGARVGVRHHARARRRRWRPSSEDGTATSFPVTVRVDAPAEVEYFGQGGILRMVLRQMLGM